MLGGNPLGDVPEILKYPVRELTVVELDAAIGHVLARIDSDGMRRIEDDPRVRLAHVDGPFFVRASRDRYDIILVQAPEPTTAAANRYYTEEFYRAARARLAPGGFLWTSVPSSDQLEMESGELSAAVFQTLRRVFPAVRATAGSANDFFAAEADGDSLMDRAALEARSRAAGVAARYYRPEYLRWADELDPRKRAFVEGRLAAAAVAVNTDLRPFSYAYRLLVWDRLSGSGLGWALRRIRRLTVAGWLRGMMLVGGIGMVTGLAVRAARCRAGRWGAGRVWTQWLLTVSLGAAGFTAMAFNLLLVFLFQAFFGYIYARLAIIAALFMSGLAAGAWAVRVLDRGRPVHAWVAVLALQAFLAAVGLLVPGLARLGAERAAGWGGRGLLEGALFVLVPLVGGAVGALFPAVNRLFRDAGGRLETAVGVTVFADNLGATLGAIVTGLILVPVLGVHQAGVALAASGGASMAWAVGAALAASGGRQNGGGHRKRQRACGNSRVRQAEGTGMLSP
jgi:hypothetical protein